MVATQVHPVEVEADEGVGEVVDMEGQGLQDRAPTRSRGHLGILSRRIQHLPRRCRTKLRKEARALRLQEASKAQGPTYRTVRPARRQRHEVKGQRQRQTHNQARKAIEYSIATDEKHLHFCTLRQSALSNHRDTLPLPCLTSLLFSLTLFIFACSLLSSACTLFFCASLVSPGKSSLAISMMCA